METNLKKEYIYYSTWNSAQCYLAAWMKGEFGGEWIYEYVWLSLFLFTWNYHNIVNWLYPSTKLKVFFYLYIYVWEKAMATHSSTLAWRIPWTEGPGGLQSMGSLGVRHNWATSLSLFTLTHWRRKWQPTPVFLPGESQGWGSLVGCRLWGCTESDTTEVI